MQLWREIKFSFVDSGFGGGCRCVGVGGDDQGEPNKTFLETLTFTWQRFYPVLFLN